MAIYHGFPILFCFSSGYNKQSSPKSILEHVKSYEITYPTWLHPHRHRRAANKEVSLSSVSLSLFHLTYKMIRKHTDTHLNLDISQLLFSDILLRDEPNCLFLPVSRKDTGSDLS